MHIKQTTFWDGDIPPIAKRKAKAKKLPPLRTWENHDYLPNLTEAKATTYDLLTTPDIYHASQNREIFVFDIECYSNYFLIAFKSLSTGKVAMFEMFDSQPLDVATIRWIMENIQVVSFNGNSYDMPILAIALAGHSASQLWLATEALIVQQERPTAVLKRFSAMPIASDHIDLIEVAPLSASLKIYAGRLHCPTMQDLPFKVGMVLTRDHADIIKWYCMNDLTNTEILYRDLEDAINLRRKLSVRYEMDLRSKSDAQIAEAVIGNSISALTGFKISRPPVLAGQSFRYQVPSFLRFQTPKLKRVLDQIRTLDFKILSTGGIATPQYLSETAIMLGNTWYKLGIGGLHSMEKRQAGLTTEDHFIVDVDVASYYPAIILNCGLYPQQLGMDFLHVYRAIVEERLNAKAAKNKLVADTLKIVINGSFGKLGSMYSILYSPNLLIQVTLTGQLSLLMLIETLELNGIEVISANTDGIVINAHNDQKELLESITAWWQQETNFVLEDTYYERIHNRDVNNYMALTTDGQIKAKGAFAKSSLKTNPTNQICVEAIETFFKDGTPVDISIKESTDITKFLTVRNVTGGAVKDGEFLGKAIRWYYAKNEDGEIVYANNGNKVPNSFGAKPAMRLPNGIPADLDHDWYVREAHKMLDQMCFS